MFFFTDEKEEQITVACTTGNVVAFQQLITSSQDANSTVRYYDAEKKQVRNLPLIIVATLHNQLEMVRYLVNTKCANIDLDDGNGNTALIIAEEKKYVEIYFFLNRYRNARIQFAARELLNFLPPKTTQDGLPARRQSQIGPTFS